MLSLHQEKAFKRPSRRRTRELNETHSSSLSSPSALFLTEAIAGLNEGAHFLERLTLRERQIVLSAGELRAFKTNETIFMQGAQHEGIFIIEGGCVRVFYGAPSGRQITLAYWTPGHFIGGPEIAGGGVHMWSGEAMEDSRIRVLPYAAIQRLITEIPNFALCLIEGLVAKGKCYSAMAQMLGTRSVIERLAQFLLNLSELYGVKDGRTVTINRRITHDQIAAMVGSTRQWVTMMLNRFKKQGILSVDARCIRIDRLNHLEEILQKGDA